MNSLHKSGMYQSLVVILLWALVKGCSAFSFIHEKNIIGDYAERGDIKYQVALMYEKSSYEKSSPFHFCGGSLISETHVLSAAHCTTWEKEDIPIVRKKNVIVRAGVTNYTDKKHAQDRYVTSWVRHPIDDIVLITVTHPFRFNSYIQPIPLIDELPEPGTHCTISGWGGPKLGDTKLKMAFNTILWREFEGRIIELLPAELTTGWTCHGDSGGPLACDGKLVGVVQGGEEDEDDTRCPKRMKIFGNVYYYKDWLIKNGFKNISLNN